MKRFRLWLANLISGGEIERLAHMADWGWQAYCDEVNKNSPHSRLVLKGTSLRDAIGGPVVATMTYATGEGATWASNPLPANPDSTLTVLTTKGPL